MALIRRILTLPLKSTSVVIALASALSLNSSQNLHAKPDLSKLKTQSIKVRATQFVFQEDAPKKQRFGKLIWRGGLSLTSLSPYFGGMSGLDISSDGNKIYAVSDSGFWLTAALSYNGKFLHGLSSARIGPVTRITGNAKTDKFNADAESIALEQPGNEASPLRISFERNHRIQRYKWIGTTLKPIGAPIRPPKGIGRTTKNRGLEAMAIFQAGPYKGMTIVFPERLKTRSGNLKGWLMGGKQQKAIFLKRLDGFNITGLAALPDGGLLLLERRFRFDEGVKMRIRRFNANHIKPGALLKGETLLQTDNAKNTIDNMEGIAAHISKSGDIILTLISDDNFNFFQRTLLMQFAIEGPKSRRADVKKAH